MRKIVRTGFCLIMDQEQSWTTDLKKSCEVLSKYFPKQSSMKKTAFIMAKKPVKDGEMLREYIEKAKKELKNAGHKDY